MTSFQRRKDVGDAHEQRVARELDIRGWAVDEWGQGVLSPTVSAALRSTDSFLRWTPDLIAAQGRHLFMIDCKSRMTSSTTDRHAVETAAVKAHLQLAAWTGLPVCYVFDNLDVLTPLDILTTGRTGPQTVRGSGSPYHLVPARHALAFDTVFGRAPGDAQQLPAA
ncbi:hypothetical protein ACFC96_43640 [Streptomyces sp. NPDC055955]|uniref:hypothetical protein n=1 Tax=Streptomyces sp. NPDC055955 TaxID=3345665 RepID=UPI0035D692FF